VPPLTGAPGPLQHLIFSPAREASVSLVVRLQDQRCIAFYGCEEGDSLLKSVCCCSAGLLLVHFQ
jgi:hypothetical protein